MSGLQLTIAELAFYQSKVYWKSLTWRVLKIALLQHFGMTRKCGLQENGT
ncbi:hypothetical protein TanjilG_10079 [Lupinus angustifolius]|uniref:Uncharacterized protein n=1 Tax=Lupinus angustifolius TaxID=3871 RepID=A0A1J7FZK0_LUPAN|nr:hypothetical protein TanjilG_10079 [Lupinus angustifolius]